MKIIFLDADGTLLHHSGIIPESTLTAVKQAQENGHFICICTGRQWGEMYGELLKIDYDGIIVGSGCTVVSKDELLLDVYFSKEQIQQLTSFFIEHQIPALYETKDITYANKIAKNLLMKLDEIHCSHLSKEEREKHGVHHLNEQVVVIQDEDVIHIPLNKITFLESDTSYKTIYNHFVHDFDLVPATFAPFGQESGEISNKEVSKGTGMDVLIKHFNIDKKDVIAIGDGYNDIPMFKNAAISIAMGNAPKDVQDICDYVTTDILDNGIYNAFKHYKLI